ncbi:MAG: hypothetical protein ACREOF_09900 [Gemmatimonadales bacterium]
MRPPLLLLLLAADLPAAAAQGTARASPVGGRSDSAAVAKGARRAQHAFERTRRAHLPIDFNDGRGACDAVIGRFCYWYRPPDERPPAEPEPIGQSRRLLLARLDEAAARRPADDWIAGQRVRYLVEQGWADAGVAAARECRGSPWWCAALEGYARHGARDYRGADSVYAVALGRMPDAERCRWTDLSALLADSDERRYRRVPCEERHALNDRIWWLARPLYSMPGHDLRTEHYARLTMARMLRGASSPHGLTWGEDLARLVVRFGWPTWWTQPFGRPGALETPAALGHEPSPSFWFFAERSVPPDRLAGETLEPPEWDPTRERPASRYAPPYARAFGEIRQAQVARFRRDGGFLTIGAFDFRRDTLFGGAEPEVALAVARDPRTPPVVGLALFPRSTGIIAVIAPWAPAIVSIEARNDAEHRAARLRTLVDPPGRWLSDVLLFIPGAELPDSLEDAVPLALRGTGVPRDRLVGLFWETYGEPAADSVEVEVTVVRGPKRRDVHPALGRTECAPEGKASVAVRWRDAATPGGPNGRAVTVDLSALKPGRYVVAVAMLASGGSACTSREIEVTKDRAVEPVD